MKFAVGEFPSEEIAEWRTGLSGDVHIAKKRRLEPGKLLPALLQPKVAPASAPVAMLSPAQQNSKQMPSAPDAEEVQGISQDNSVSEGGSEDDLESPLLQRGELAPVADSLDSLLMYCLLASLHSSVLAAFLQVRIALCCSVQHKR